MSVSDSVLARKLSRRGVARSPLPDTDLVGETFARQVENRIRPLVKSTISAMVLETRIVKVSEAVQNISVPSMLALIDVEDADTQGLVCVDTDLSYHLIDLTLGGDPATASVPTTRTFTAIDMALCKLHIEAMIQAFAAAVSFVVGRPLTKEMRIGEQRQNISQLRFAPDYVDVFVISLALDIGEAARAGNLDFMLPLATLDVIRAGIQTKPSDADRDRPENLWRTHMRRAAAGSPVVVTGVLFRKHLTLAAIEKFRPGDILEIPETAPDEVELIIPQPGGKSMMVASGKLGAYKGRKVVKLETPIDPRVKKHIDGAI